MNRFWQIACGALLGLGFLGGNPANAATYSYLGEITRCTVTCDSFNSLTEGSIVSGFLEIDVDAGGSFADPEISSFQLTITNEGIPLSDPDPSPVTTNPSYVSNNAMGFSNAASNGSYGSTDADNELESGLFFVQLLTPPLSDDGAFVVTDLVTGSGELCAYYLDFGCTSVTSALAFEGQFSLVPEVPLPAAAWLFGSALLGLVGVAKRRAA